MGESDLGDPDVASSVFSTVIYIVPFSVLDLMFQVNFNEKILEVLGSIDELGSSPHLP